jgi:hypothetical protein
VVPKILRGAIFLERKPQKALSLPPTPIEKPLRPHSLLVHGVLLNLLPYHHLAQFVSIYRKDPAMDQAPVNYLSFLDWQRASESFSLMAIHHHEDYNLTGAPRPNLSTVSWYPLFFQRSASILARSRLPLKIIASGRFRRHALRRLRHCRFGSERKGSKHL